jgi:hypothetical protein
MLCYGYSVLASKLCIYNSVYRSEHIDVQIILLIVASGSPKRDWQRGREKKDREEEVLSPDPVMQALCFLEWGLALDTTTFIVFQSPG